MVSEAIQKVAHYEDMLARLEQLNEIGTALSSERDTDRLLEKILLASKSLTNAEAGTLYRIREDGKSLHFEIVRNDRLGIVLGGTSGNPINFPDLPLLQEDGTPNNAMVAAYAAINGQTVNIADAYSERGFDFSGTRRFDESTGYRSQSFLTVPMKNHENEIIGVLQLINALDSASGEVIAFAETEQRLAESLASQAAIALTNHQLITQLEVLFESFIGMMNTAIDEKSPYTGGHCQRVPELTMMIADAVAACSDGPFADFAMSEKDVYELKIAGMLHDCGKVTTPVHVVDKSTKLETIFDRIELIDTRFEVIKRDEEIAALREILDLRQQTEPQAEAECLARYEMECAEIESERDFLRQTNIGGEAMRPEDQQRVREIGTSRSWLNPAGAESHFLTEDEIDNLSIRAGTLTAKEREVINHHIVATIGMLEAMPWPKHLKNVPEYAGGHHERMDGKGYPRGLTAGQMSVQARIMAIADIFEALTARDRPYKKGMKLSEAIRILTKFSENGHIDPQLFEIFMRERVYQRYADKFMAEEQIDAVVVEASDSGRR